MRNVLGPILVGTCLSVFGTSVSALERNFGWLDLEPVPSARALFWEQLDAQQRAALWPLLSHKQRLFQWRYMTKQERQAMRQNMTAEERQTIKYRYIVEADGQTEAQIHKELTNAERSLLRRQVRQVHFTIQQGVPYNCDDPIDCPKNAVRIRAAEDSALFEVPTPQTLTE